jgi:hypothetical protein
MDRDQTQFVDGPGKHHVVTLGVRQAESARHPLGEVGATTGQFVERAWRLFW